MCVGSVDGGPLQGSATCHPMQAIATGRVCVHCKQEGEGRHTELNMKGKQNLPQTSLFVMSTVPMVKLIEGDSHAAIGGGGGDGVIDNSGDLEVVEARIE